VARLAAKPVAPASFPRSNLLTSAAAVVNPTGMLLTLGAGEKRRINVRKEWRSVFW
jgi:hypothetical protein